MIVVSPARAIELSNQGYFNNPFVAWDNLGRTATLGGTATIAGGERANAVTGSTYDKWRATTGGSGLMSFSFDFGTPTAISFAAIVNHNIGTLGGSVSVQYSSDDVTYTDAGAGAIEPVAREVLAWRFALRSARYWRFRFTDIPAAVEANMAIAFLGNELIIPERFYQGFSPVITPTEVELQSNVSVGNELLGSSVIGRGSTLSATIDHLPAEFIRGSDWLSFQRHFNDGGGSLFGWRPQKYPQDIYYVWRQGAVLRPDNAGPRDRMSVAMGMRVHNAQP